MLILSDAKAPDLTKNIKINIKKNVAGKTKRTSTTLNYSLCDFYFGKVLNPAIRSKLTLTDPIAYRKWLEKELQGWVNEQTLTTQQQLETALSQAIYEAGVTNGS